MNSWTVLAIQTEWPEAYFGPEIWFEEWPEHWKCRTIALDPSKGKDARFGDYSAFVMFHVDLQGTCYIDADLEVRNISLIVETALELCRTFRPDAFAVEPNPFQKLLATELNRVATERSMYLPLFMMNNHVPKVVRIRRLTSLLAQGRLKFKAGSPGARLLVEQLRDFPSGDHDDGPDALEMALRMAEQVLTTPPDYDSGCVEIVYA